MLEKEYTSFREQKIKSPKGSFTYTDNGQRITTKRRGGNKYFCFIQERFGDIYCFLKCSRGFPKVEDNFKKENLCFVDKNKDKVIIFLTNLSKEKNKSITFSIHSIKLI